MWEAGGKSTGHRESSILITNCALGPWSQVSGCGTGILAHDRLDDATEGHTTVRKQDGPRPHPLPLRLMWEAGVQSTGHRESSILITNCALGPWSQVSGCGTGILAHDRLDDATEGHTTVRKQDGHAQE